MHAIRDQLLTTNELLSTSYLRNILHCDIDQAKRTSRRARQLYPDIKQVKIFDKFAYYYLDSMRLEDLRANVEMKKNYIRKGLAETVASDITGKQLSNGSLTSLLKEQSFRDRITGGILIMHACRR